MILKLDNYLLYTPFRPFFPLLTQKLSNIAGFGPLSCQNLFQVLTSNMYVIHLWLSLLLAFTLVFTLHKSHCAIVFFLQWKKQIIHLHDIQS